MSPALTDMLGAALAAGVAPAVPAQTALLLPEFGPSRDPGQVLVGAAVAGVAAYLSVRFLTRYFTTRTLTPFAIYCLVAGVACIARFA